MTKFAESFFSEVFDPKLKELSFIRQVSVNSASDTYEPGWIPELIEYFLRHDQSGECIPNRLVCMIEMLSATSKFAYVEGYFAGKED